VVIAATDSLESRALVYGHFDTTRQVSLYARSGGLGLTFYCLTPESGGDERGHHQATLTGPGYDLPCGASSIAFASLAAGAFVPALIRNVLAGKDVLLRSAILHRQVRRLVAFQAADLK